MRYWTSRDNAPATRLHRLAALDTPKDPTVETKASSDPSSSLETMWRQPCLLIGTKLWAPFKVDDEAEAPVTSLELVPEYPPDVVAGRASVLVASANVLVDLDTVGGVVKRPGLQDTLSVMALGDRA